MHRTIPFLLLLLTATAGASPSTVDEIDRCVRDNLPRRNSTQTVRLRSINRVGDATETTASIFWQQGEDGLSKVLLRFEKPLDMRGAGVLMLEKVGRLPDTFLYLPATRSVRRVSSRAASSSLFGTDFSYEDFQRLLGMAADAKKEREDDTEIAGRTAYVVTAWPGTESDSIYDRVVSTIDQATCVPLRVESFERGGELRKRLSIDVSMIAQQGDSWIPLHQTMEDLRDSTRTEVVVEAIDLDTEINRKVFSTRELESGAN